MERKIGETFEFEGKIYETIGFPSNSCFSCAFIKLCRSGMGEVIGNCCGDLREDKTDVFFKEIKNNMEIKNNQLTIDIPEGHIIDVEHSNLSKGIIKFKKIDITYKDIEDALNLEKDLTGVACNVNNVAKLSAIDKLINIANYYNKGWKPDWNNDVEFKYHIVFDYFDDMYKTRSKSQTCNNAIYFAHREDAQAVIDNPNFREILDAVYKN